MLVLLTPTRITSAEFKSEIITLTGPATKLDVQLGSDINKEISCVGFNDGYLNVLMVLFLYCYIEELAPPHIWSWKCLNGVDYVY